MGQAPKFSRNKEGSSGWINFPFIGIVQSVTLAFIYSGIDVKYGTGVETNEHRIETRLKQIQFGKNTIGYDNYLAAVPK